MSKFNDDSSWDSANFRNPSKNSLRKKNQMPKLKIDELELYEPKVIKTMNEMIVECDEVEEHDTEDKHLKTFKSKRQRVDGIFSQLIKSDDIRSKSFQSLKILKSDRSLPRTQNKNIILEDLDENSYEDY